MAEKYQYNENYPLAVMNREFLFEWCCDCGLRHVSFLEIERGKTIEQDTVNIFCVRDSIATNYRKDYERLKKKRKKK